MERQDAEDIVQNTFFKLYIIHKDFIDDEHVKRWLIRVAVNDCKNFLNSYWRKKKTSLEAIQDRVLSFETKGNSDLFHVVCELPEKYRIVVHLYYYEEYSVKEISDIIHRKETTIQTQLMRARTILKERLKEEWSFEQ